MSSSPPSVVCIQKSTYCTIDIHSLLESLGGIAHYVQKGDRVLLKTSLLIPSDPKKAVVTHPTVVKAVAEEIIKIGGVPYIGDSPSGQFTRRRLEKTYRKSGLVTIANELGVELNYDTGVTKIDIPQAKKLKKTPYCNYVLNADKIIAFPKIKTHIFMIMTLATKVMFGAIPGLTKAKYHSLFIKRAAFADMLLDVLSFKKPDLFLMDGVVGMQGDGPSGGEPVDLGILLASEDAIAMDLSVCSVLGIEPMWIPTLRQAKLRHLWPSEIHYPLLTPQDIQYSGFRLPSIAGSRLTDSRYHRLQPLPTEKCTACSRCVEICPKQAICIKDNRAVINYSHCIACYCCHEVCPYEAIKLEHVPK